MISCWRPATIARAHWGCRAAGYKCLHRRRFYFVALNAANFAPKTEKKIKNCELIARFLILKVLWRHDGLRRVYIYCIAKLSHLNEMYATHLYLYMFMHAYHCNLQYSELSSEHVTSPTLWKKNTNTLSHMSSVKVRENKRYTRKQTTVGCDLNFRHGLMC